MISLDINDSTILVVFVLFFLLAIFPALITFRLLKNWKFNNSIKLISSIIISIAVVFLVLILMYKITGRGLLQ